MLLSSPKRPTVKSLLEEAATLALTHKTWWQSWEFYLIALLAIALRLYRIDTAQYMDDHNTFYQMAHDVVAHGMWPISGNKSSTGPLIPPLFIYIMLIPAAISPNPLAGNIFIALCNIAAVLLTYIFVRRYFGRLPAAIAALLYATAINVIIFSRDIWQPDLMPLFAILLMFMLFRGVVEEKRYWFLPAVLLIGAMYQLHNTGIYLLVPLFVALALTATKVSWQRGSFKGGLLAFKTIHWSELPLTLLGLLLLFTPYIYLQQRNGYRDIHLLLDISTKSARFDNASLWFYRVFTHSFVLNPLHQYNDTHLIPGNKASILLTIPWSFIAQFMPSESRLMEYLLVGSIFSAIVMVLWSTRLAQRVGLPAWLKISWPQRKGLILLLAWQGLVVFMLSHPVNLYIHYLTYLLPGPFILIGLLLANLAKPAHRLRLLWQRLIYSGLYIIVGLLVVVQTVGSAGWLIDHARGNFDSNYNIPQYFDLATVQRITNEADQLARQQHLSRAYIDISGDDKYSVYYLAQFVQTPMMVFDSEQCMVLPGAESGSVVYVTDPHRADIDALLQRYTNARLLKEIPHPGGEPFKMYTLSAKPLPQPALQLGGGVQLLSEQADVLSNAQGNPSWLATRWKIPTTQAPQSRTTYQYAFNFQQEGTTNNRHQQFCSMSRTWAGDQLIPFFSFNGLMSQRLEAQVQSFSSAPQHFDMGSLQLVTFFSTDTPRITLYTKDGQQTIIITVPASMKTDT